MDWFARQRKHPHCSTHHEPKRTDSNAYCKYEIPYSLLVDCVKQARINNHDYSIHYFDLTERHDNVPSYVNLGTFSSILEIGGGLGSQINFMLANYRNIKKALYSDIALNLDVATQLFKAFYGEDVSDYRALRNAHTIHFVEADHLEIYYIAPWQIENFRGILDILLNSNSILEMPNKEAENYARKFSELRNTESVTIALTTYDKFDTNTLNPNDLQNLFAGRHFTCFEAETLLDTTRINFYFVSSCKFSRSH